MNTSKTKAFWGAIVFAISGAIGFVADVPPSLQDNFILALQAVVPLWARPETAAVCKLVTLAAFLYTTVHAARSGPATPPANTVAGDPVSSSKPQ